MSEMPRSFHAVFEGVTTIAKRHPRDPLLEEQGATYWVGKIRANRSYKERCERIALEVERMADFHKLESDLLPLGWGREPIYLGRRTSGKRVSEKVELTPIASLKEAFARLGLYHDILAGQPEQVVWERLEAAMKKETREIKTIFPLLGCDLPHESGRVGLIKKLSYEDWLKLGPRGEEQADLLYPYEKTASFAGSWYVESTETTEDVLVCHTGGYSFPCPSWSREDIIEYQWVPLLLLALCHSGLFNISSFVVCHPGWSCEIWDVSNIDRDAPWSKYESPGRDSVAWANWADRFYGIADGVSFSRLFNRMGGALRALDKSKVWVEDELWAVAVRYLRTLFLETPDLNSDHVYEDVLVQYVTCLEKLLVRPGEKEELTEKLRTRGALMAGRNETEREGIRDFLNNVYKVRSNTVHSSKPNPSGPVDLRHLRDVCRRVMGCKLLIAEQMASPKELDNALKNLTISSEYTRLAEKAAREIGSLSWCWERQIKS
jgi:hypothetical protein